MARTETIQLADPFELHQKKVTAIKLKEPSGRLYSKLGEPRLVIHAQAGGAYFVEQPEAINAYLEGTIDHEFGADLLGLMSMEDVMQLKLALFSFFEGAGERIVARKSTPLYSAQK